MRKKVLLTVIFIVMVFGVAFLGEIKNQRDLILEGGQTGRTEEVKKNYAENNITATGNNEKYNPINFERQNGMWFTAMDYAETLDGKTEEQFRKEMQRRFLNAVTAGVNTVYVHVRANGDAYYNSKVYPKAEYMGEYDVLEVLTETAHSLGLSVHAWINPLRCQTTEQMKNVPEQYKIRNWADENINIEQVDGRYWLNPASEEATDLIAEGVKEIVENYKVDGIHIDDYFYPTTDESFDSVEFKKSGETNLEEWRLENSCKLVKKIHDTVKGVNKNILFGISPQGSIDMNYTSQYADVRRWTSERGYCDYIVPQLYYGFDNELCPYEETLNRWSSMVEGNDSVKLVIGLCTYKQGKPDEWAGKGINEWIENDDVFDRQKKLAELTENVSGISIYSYASTFE